MRVADNAHRLGLFLELTGRRVLVVGGGAVSHRRVVELLACGALVTVVAPRIADPIRVLAEQGDLGWEAREFVVEDLLGSPAVRPWLVHTAVGSSVDLEVRSAAESAGIWCVVASSATSSPAWVAATARGPDDVTVAVSGGGDPGRAVALRNAVAARLATGSFPMRRRRPSDGLGWVALVGGGPGDPGLLTVRGRQLLALADVVVTDRLAPMGVVSELDEDVLVVDVGKQRGRHPVPQEQINSLLVEHAAAGRRVVRLKGGDPFVLGRGGEEAEYCARAGIPVEWVPGVTSAVAAPAAAGVPVTHRGLSTSFLVASGHEAARIAASAPKETTLVLLMGVKTLPDTVALLLESGRPEDLPVVLIERAWTERQRVVRSTLGAAPDDARSADVRPPAVIVIGAVAALADLLGEARRVVNP